MGSVGAALAALVAGAAAAVPLSAYARSEGSRLGRPWLAAGAAAIACMAGAAFGWRTQLVPAAVLGVGLWFAAAIDMHTRRIPNVLNAGLAVAGVALRLLGLLHGWWGGIVSAAVAGAVFSGLAIATRGGFGWGDAKLAAVIGWFLGPGATAEALFAAVIAAGLGAGIALALRRVGWRDALPFAPFFLVGGCVALALSAAATGAG